MMSGIRGKDTKPELLIRSALHRRGFRFRIHDKKLPGKPDIVLPKYRAIIQIHGCFWHQHNCHLFKWPDTRADFWKNKIQGNVLRDTKRQNDYHELGWRVLTIWECALKGKTRLSFDKLIDLIADWLKNGQSDLEISGKNQDT